MEDGKTSNTGTSSLHPSRLPVFSFVGGKGGVGKTTHAALAAIAALRPGRSGRPADNTLLVTPDPASSLSMALGTPVGAAAQPVPGVGGLFAANVDAAAA